MQLELELKDKTLIVSISGEIDHHTCMDIRQQIDKCIEKGIIRDIIFDFAKVNFMDSSGIGVIIGRYKKIQEIGGKVGVVNLLPQIKRIFEISGLFKIILLYESVDEALKDMKEGEE